MLQDFKQYINEIVKYVDINDEFIFTDDKSNFILAVYKLPLDTIGIETEHSKIIISRSQELISGTLADLYNIVDKIKEIKRDVLVEEIIKENLMITPY